MKNLDLFGRETEAVQNPTILQLARYRKATPEEKEAGYVCKNCRYLITVDYHDKRYFKCEWIGLSHSAATDIRLSGICPKFEVE